MFIYVILPARNMILYKVKPKLIHSIVQQYNCRRGFTWVKIEQQSQIWPLRLKICRQ